MTLGQRISQKRKELSLSQEALGEKLGVSRQAIYKWESDTTLPEIEKLISLSKLFGVSVGCLLGVEDEKQAEPIGAETACDGELTETQLKMVEEIVRRYLDAQPQKKPMRKWPWVIVIIAAVIVLYTFGSKIDHKIDQMNNQYNNLQNAVDEISSTVNYQVSGITSRVEAILKSQNELTAEYGTVFESADLSANTVEFSMRAVPKVFEKGLTAVFQVETDGVTSEFPAELLDGREFYAEASVELSDMIVISVVFIDADGTRRTQILDAYEGLFTASIPEIDIQDWLFGHSVKNGTVEVSDLVVTVRKQHSSSWEQFGDIKISDMRVGIFLNKKMIGQAEECEKPEGWRGFSEEDRFYKIPNMKINITAEDELVVAALVRDSFGRYLMISGIPMYPEFEEGREDGYLMYPSVVEMDHDPENWKF